MNALKERWKTFACVILDPWSVLLTIVVGGLLCFSLQKTPEATTFVLLSILLALTSAVLGGRVSQQWIAATESGILATRGRSAVSGLKLLLRNIAALEARVQSFQVRESESQKFPVVVKRSYEEVLATCSLLQEETVSSIENWTDIVPEADIRTQIVEITSLKAQIDEKEYERELLQKVLNETKGESKQERARLCAQIQEKDDQIRKLQQEVIHRDLDVFNVSPRSNMLRMTLDTDRIAQVYDRLMHKESNLPAAPVSGKDKKSRP